MNRIALTAALILLNGSTHTAGWYRPRYRPNHTTFDPYSNRSKKLTAKMDAKRARDAARKGKG